MSTSGPTGPLHEWVPPEEFDEYRVLHLLGRGAMGTVYLVRDSLLDRTVAVKFIGSGEPDRRDRRRFLIEARAIARLQHPNVVGIHRVGEVGGRPYLVSEFVRGKSLEKLEKPMPWQQALRIGVGLSRGLAAAHRSSVLHRDLKPSNAIVEEGGEAKLLDFGLAKLLDARALLEGEASVDASVDLGRDSPLGLAVTEAGKEAAGDGVSKVTVPRGQAMRTVTLLTPSPISTRTGTLLGTPLYMSPEVWRGERATARSDVYSLGVLLYELCAGRVPHDEAGRPELGRAITERDAPKLASLAPDVHPLLASIIERCLSRDAEARFASGEELRQALEQLVPPRQRIEWAATEWERMDRAGEALWSERQLAEGALAVVDERGLSPSEVSFLRASRRALRRRRLARWGLVVGLPLLVASVFLADQLLARRRLDRLVAVQEARSSVAHNEARALHGKAGEERRRALLQFDAGSRRKEAEGLWSGALILSGQAEEAYVRADQALEVALTLAGDRPVVRRRLGEIIFERILLAEERHLSSQRRELLQRLPIYDPDGALQARLRAPASLTVTSVPAATVVIERYDDVAGQRRLQPIATGQASAVRPLPPGSYLLTISAPEHETVRYPVLLGRGAVERVAIDLPAAGTVPAGYVYVPPGPFLFGSSDDETLRTTFLSAPPLHRVQTGAYLIARTEVTIAEWLEFLRALPQADRARRMPDVRSLRGVLQLREKAPGAWELTLRVGTQTLTGRSGAPLRYPTRTRRAVQDWLRFPISGISLGDAQAYLQWLDRSSRLPGARLCSEKEWERAARGADERLFPHGDRLEPDDANFDETYDRTGYGPDEVGSHPASASPFGVLDMVGNAMEWTASASSSEPAVVRGGAWYFDSLSDRSNNREVADPGIGDLLVGMRVCKGWRAP